MRKQKVNDMIKVNHMIKVNPSNFVWKSALWFNLFCRLDRKLKAVQTNNPKTDYETANLSRSHDKLKFAVYYERKIKKLSKWENENFVHDSHGAELKSTNVGYGIFKSFKFVSCKKTCPWLGAGVKKFKHCQKNPSLCFFVTSFRTWTWPKWPRLSVSLPLSPFSKPIFPRWWLPGIHTQPIQPISSPAPHVGRPRSHRAGNSAIMNAQKQHIVLNINGPQDLFCLVGLFCQF